MMSIKTIDRSGVFWIRSIACRPLVALITSIPWPSSSEVRAKMLRASSSTTSTLRPCEDLVGAVQPLEHRLLLGRQIGDHPVQEERRLVEQPLRRLDVLEDDALGHRS